MTHAILQANQNDGVMPAFRRFFNNDDTPRELTQSIALEEASVPNVLRTGVSVVGVLMVAFFLWAGIAKVEEIAVASGQVIPSGYIQSIQHLEGGIIRQIMVEEGQVVEKGQPLLKLDDTAANADLGQMLARHQSLQAQAARLQSFVNGTVNDTGKMTPEETAILASMQQARASQLNVINDQITQKQKELGALSATHSALEKNVGLLAKENSMYETMAAQGYGSKLMAMTSERELNQMRGQINENASQQRAAQAAIREAESRKVSLDADLKQEAMKNLGQVQAELAELDKSLNKLQGTANRTVITSPVRGIVKGLAVHTIGAVAEPGKVLMEIVPMDEKMVVEAMVSPSDIGNLRPGQDAKVKISAFDFSRYGSVHGRLESISASTFQAKEGENFYKVKIGLDQNYIGRDPSHNQITPGMMVQADIISGDKTILQYLLKPIHLAASTALHER